jgi:O-acetyl-ADP-ribose deacetylase (regulator of RNase III)
MTVNDVRVGDILSSNAQTLVNTVNCVGVMGKGIAAAFKSRFPKMYKDYEERCRRHEVRLGEPYLYKLLVGPWILNFPTKDHWRSVSRLSDIIAGLEYLELHYKEWGIESLAVPPLGCGNGQLDWNVVGPTLYRYLDKLDIPVEMFAPIGTPSDQLRVEFLIRDSKSGVDDLRSVGVSLPAAAIALVGVVSRITRERYHWPIGRTTFQKIAYFLTEEGIPTGLRYERGSYGPFSAQLKPMIGSLMNHNVISENRRGQMLEITPGPTYSDARTLYIENLKEWAPIIEKVADLFLRMPRTSDAELAATVHFAAKELRPVFGRQPTEQEVLEEVKRWKVKRRPPLRDRDVAGVIRHLNLLGWVELSPSSELPVAEDHLMYA